MEIWIDSAKIEEIEEAVKWGIITGVTTNPSLMMKAGTADLKTNTQRIIDLVGGPVSAEVVSDDAAGMIAEAEKIVTWSSHVVIKVPITPEGLQAMKVISEWPAKVNATLIFSANQALLAVRAGATYVSPFVGRLDDAGQDGMEVVREIAAIFSIHDIETKIVAASIRHPRHVTEAALAGADIATVPFKVLQAIVRHPLTDVGLQRFKADWNKALNSAGH